MFIFRKTCKCSFMVFHASLSAVWSEAGCALYLLSYEKPNVYEEYLYFISCFLATFQDTLLVENRSARSCDPYCERGKVPNEFRKKPDDVLGNNVTPTLRKVYLSVNFVCMLTSKTLQVSVRIFKYLQQQFRFENHHTVH